MAAEYPTPNPDYPTPADEVLDILRKRGYLKDQPKDTVEFWKSQASHYSDVIFRLNERIQKLTAIAMQFEDRAKATEAEIARIRTTEHASAHALDCVRQHLSLDLISDEHPNATLNRILKRISDAEEESQP